MGIRLTDAELAKLIAKVRREAVSGTDFGDVGFLFEELDEHIVLEELVAARKVIAAARNLVALGAVGPTSESIEEYDKLFADAEARADAQAYEGD